MECRNYGFCDECCDVLDSRANWHDLVGDLGAYAKKWYCVLFALRRDDVIFRV